MGLVLMLLVLTTAIVLAQASQPEQTAGLDAPSVSTTAAEMPADISVTKSVNLPEVKPDSRVAYTVVFSNSGSSDIALDVITDVLPVPFQYAGMAAGSDVVDHPDDMDEPAIVWQGTFTVPATGTLTLRYYAEVPEEAKPSTVPYTNTVTAAYTETAEYTRTLVGPAYSTVTVVSPDVHVTKTAAPEEIELGDAVTYTVVFANEGNAQALIETISDTLPLGFVFKEMLPGSTITDTPTGTQGTITWGGPFTVPASTAVTLTYQVEAEDETAREVINEVVAVIDGELTEPATATVKFAKMLKFFPVMWGGYIQPHFVVTKEPAEYEVVKGETAIYTVQVKNGGSVDGEVEEIQDTLPAGFTFLNMEANSGVSKAPTGKTGTIVWRGPFEIKAGQTLTLIYKVQVSEVVGLYENSVVVEPILGVAPPEPAIAEIKVKEPYLLWEDWESGTDGWEPFLNYWRLHPEQWYIEAGTGWNGSKAMNHTYYLGVTDPRGAERGAHDALYMYRAPGSEEWLDYRLEARLILHEGEKGEQMGLWFRGKYEEPEDPAIDGKYVQGYYLIFRPRDDRTIVLNRLKSEGSTALHFSDPETLAVADRPMARDTWYHFVIEVRGSNIKVWVEGELVIDHNDATWGRGTVGLFCYKIEKAAWDDILVTPLD